MSPKAGKRVLKPGTSSVFIGAAAARSALGWRLDVREDGRGNKELFSKRKRPAHVRGRSKLFHYIAAGGMRQLRRTSADDVAEHRRRSFLFFLTVLAAVWVLFRYLPSA